jgi:trigger factor
MQVTKKNLTETSVQLTIVADATTLETVKRETLEHLAGSVKLAGFREGKAPLSMIEKQVDPSRLQTEFLDRVMNRVYSAALEKEKLRPVDQPEVKITKFVPFDALEIEATVEVVGDVTLPDYKNFKLAKEKVTIAAKEVDEVLDNLLKREAEKKETDRAAQNGDEVVIDFKGVDAKTKEPIAGADGKEYPLLLGSDTFIPGFEANVVGVKPGEEKTFVLTFPKDYGVKALQNRKVEFTITAKKVNEVVAPKLDDAFAAKVGPFKTIAELKEDVKKQLEAEKNYRAEQQYADDLLTKLAEKAKVAIPKVLIDEQVERIERDQRQNLTYRGTTWKEFLELEGLTEEAYREAQRPTAELRVKAGLVLTEIADLEGIEVSKEELQEQLTALEARYPDAKMRAEMAKPEVRRDIISRLMTDKTMAKLKSYASANS